MIDESKTMKLVEGAQADLRAAEIRYRRLFESARDGILILDAVNRKITDVNPFMIEMLGYSRDEFLGRELWEIGLLKDEEANKAAFQELLEQGYIRYEDLPLKTKEGDCREIEFVSNVYAEGDRQVIQCNIRDISARKAAEEALRESDERFRRYFELGLIGMAITSPEKALIEVNEQFCEILGYERSELLLKTWSELTHPDDLGADVTQFDQVMAGEMDGYSLEKRWIRKNGQVIDTTISVKCMRRADSSVDYFVALIQEVTKRKLAEEEQRLLIAQIENQRQRLNNIVATVPGVVWEVWGGPESASERIGFVSDYVENMLGYSVEEWRSTPNFWLSIVHVDDRERTAQAYSASFSSGASSSREFRWVSRDGRVIWVAANSVPIKDEEGRPIGLRGVAIDITERKQAEEALRASEERYRSLFESNPLPMWVYDLETLAFLAVNAAAIQHYGYSPEEFLSMTIEDICPPEAGAALLKTASTESDAVVWSLRKKDHSLIKVEITAHELVFAGIRAQLVLANDITERKRGEEMQARRTAQLALRADVNAALAESESPLLTTLERCTDAAVQHLGAALAGIWTLNQAENVLELQASSGVQTHMDDGHVRVPMGAFKIGLIAQERQPYITNDILGDPRLGDKEWNRREGMIAFAGCPLIVEDRLVGVIAMYARQQLADDTVDALASIADTISQDIERKRAEQALGMSEEQLRQSQKLEAVGQLAGGIAHDFNNLLTVITGYSDLTMGKLRPEDPLRTYIEEIKKAGDRATSLTRQLLAFSRKQVLQPKILNLNSVISDLEKLLRRLIGENIELRTVLETELGSVKADPGQIEQVIMNLAVNARDAMPGGGKLTVETQNINLDEEYANLHIAVNAGRFVMLAVTDTGTGMDPATRKHIFEPFFTTKEVGKGTGLGLSTVYGIIKQSGGNVWVYSEVGHGTTFKIYLPCIGEDAQKYKPAAEIGATVEGTETILLAEDEEVVRKLALQVLTAHGYQVLEAANGGSAFLICERHKGPIHMLVTDIIMPEMGGRELSDRLSLLRPEMKVLYMSGYTDSAILHQGVLDADANFIQKPFTPNDLARKVREVLDRG
jgi:two-component system cell cycle sensor histidine kinase/response regulator CckA